MVAIVNQDNKIYKVQMRAAKLIKEVKHLGYNGSDEVLEDRPRPQGSSRTRNHVLGLESHGLVFGFESPGLDYMHLIK